MIPKGLFTQIVMVILAVSIVMTYVKPAFSAIASTQDTIEKYKQEKNKTASVNELLTTLSARLDSVSNNDKRELLTYLPDLIDEIAITRDLSLIAAEAGVSFKDAKYLGEKVEVAAKGSVPAETTSLGLPKKYAFSLDVEGTYTQLKNLFSLIQQNNYPLEVHGLKITKLEGGFLQAEIQLMTYSYQETTNNDNKIVF